MTPINSILDVGHVPQPGNKPICRLRPRAIWDDRLCGRPNEMMGKRSAFAAVIGLAGLLLSPGASASQVCQGTYVTAAFHPLPKHITVEVAVRTPSPRTLHLVQEFLKTVRKAGVAVSTPATVVLHVNTSLVSSTADQFEGRQQRTDFFGTQGGVKLRLPDMPSRGMTSPPSSTPLPLRAIRIEATVRHTGQTSWLASVRCRMIGTDEEQLARDLGQLVGRTLGRTTEQQPF